MSVASNSLRNPEKLLELENQLFKATNSVCTVERDDLKRPTVTGGSFAEMCEMNGYVTASDRFWSVYFLIRIMCGKLSTIIGADGIPSDDWIHRQDYDDDEYMSQYNTFSRVTTTGIENFIAGFNRGMDDINNGVLPRPAQIDALTVTIDGVAYPYVPTHISLLDFIRFGYHVTSDYSPQKIAMNSTLESYAQIMNLMVNEGMSQADAVAAVEDLYDTRLQRANGIVADSAPTNQLPLSANMSFKMSASKTDVTNSNNKAKKSKTKPKTNTSKQGTSSDGTKPISLAEYLQKYNEVTEFRRSKGVKCSTQDHLNSFAFVVSGAHTSTNEPMLGLGPQVNTADSTGFEFIVNMVNDELGFKHAVVGHLFGSMGVFGRNGYKYATASVLGSLPGVAALFQDPSEDRFVRNATFDVRFGAPVTVPVYDSPYGGFVLQRNVQTSDGVKSLVARNLDYGNEIQFFDTYFLTQFCEDIKQLKDTIRGPGWSTGMDIFIFGADNQGHTFCGERAGWYDFAGSNVIPQGVMNEPIPDSSTIPKQSGYFVEDNTKGYAVQWNSAMIQQMPSVYGDNIIARVGWIEEKIEALIANGGRITEGDMRDIMVHIGNGAQGPSPISNKQEYWTDSYHDVYKERFTQAVQTYATQDRTTAVNMLATFNGGMVPSDETLIINSNDLQDEFLLSQRWLWEVQAALIKATFGDTAWAQFTASSDMSQAVGTYYCNSILGLTARVLGCSTLQNELNYPDWASNVGDLDLLIVDALDRSLSALGGLSMRPWGKGKRQNVVYTEPFFGQLPLPCPGPVANRASLYGLFVFDQNNGVSVKAINTTAQNTLIQFTPYPNYVNTDQQCDYMSWNLKPLITL